MASVDNGVFILESVVRGHHRLYISVWTRHEGEQHIQLKYEEAE